MAAGSGPPHPILSLRGTEGSNPAPSGGESAANLISSIRAIHELGLPGDVGKWGNGSHLASGLAPQPSAPTPQAMQQLACRDNPYCELKPLIAPVGLEMPHARGVRSPYEETGATVAAFARPVRLRPVDRRSTPCLSPIAPRTSSLAMQTQRRRLRRTRPERSAWPEPEPTSSGPQKPEMPNLFIRYQIRGPEMISDQRRAMYENWLLARGFQDLARRIRESLGEAALYLSID